MDRKVIHQPRYSTHTQEQKSLLTRFYRAGEVHSLFYFKIDAATDVVFVHVAIAALFFLKFILNAVKIPW